MEKHITLVAALQIAFGILGILIAMVLFVLVAGGGMLSGDPQAMWITTLIGTIIASFLIITSLPGVIGGIGLLKRRSWARILVLIVAALDLLNIPIGTAIGIYTIWVLLQDETVRSLSSPSGFPKSPQLPPSAGPSS